MISFASPVYFFLVLPLLAAGWTVYRKRARTALRFAATHRIPAHGTTWRTAASRILPALYIAGLLLLITALAGPRTTLAKIRRTGELIAIEMVVDISGSMDALDMSRIEDRKIIEERTRLDVVKETFAEFVDRRSEDMIGLVVFGGYASTRAPLTTDHDALLHTLKGVNTPTHETHGNDPEEWRTAVGDALATACARLKDFDVKSKTVVLLSDGESNTGIIRPRDAARAAKALGIKVYTIGIGSTGRAPVKVMNDFSMKSIQWVDVVLDEKLLKDIADETGGRYFNVKDPGGLAKALEHIDKLEKTEVERAVYHRHKEMFPWFLASGLTAIFMSAGLNVFLTKKIV